MGTNVIVNRNTAPNIDLLNEEITALGIGNFFIGVPGSYPRDIVVRCDDDLTAQQITDVTNAVTNHDETLLSTSQTRELQDTTDLDSLRTAFYTFDTLTSTEKEDAYKKAIRIALRAIRSEEI